MIITRELVANKIADYLHHTLSVSSLVDWAENVLMDSEFAEGEERILQRVVGRLGLADIREFGLTWEDCESLLSDLGFRAKVDVVSA